MTAQKLNSISKRYCWAKLSSCIYLNWHQALKSSGFSISGRVGQGSELKTEQSSNSEQGSEQISKLNWPPTNTAEEEDGGSPPAKRGGARRSDIFSAPKSKFKRECSSYELLPVADSGINLLLWWTTCSSSYSSPTQLNTAKIEQLIIVKCNVQLLRVFGGKMQIVWFCGHYFGF